MHVTRRKRPGRKTGSPKKGPPRKPFTDSQKSFRDAMMSFERRLLPHIVGMHSENSVHSAFSAFKVLALTLCGAAGTTRDEMGTALSFPQLAYADGWEETVLKGVQGWAERLRCKQVAFADAVFVNENCKLIQDFQTRATEIFKAKCESTTFPSPGLDLVNGYVAEQTNGMIPHLLDDLDASTIACLINCVYFKANWASKFLASATKKEPFRLLGETTSGASHEVQMMRQRNVRHGYGEHNIGGVKFESCTMKYRANGYKMLFLKPLGATPKTAPTDAEFGAFLKVLETTDNFLLKVVKRGQAELKLSTLRIPKFSLETETKMNAMLQALGMNAAFGARADFSGLVEDPQAYISLVLQKAVMQVDEEGTKAAAATAVVMRKGCARPAKTHNFVLDSPFVCQIVHGPTATVLFTGVVRKPVFKEL